LFRMDYKAFHDLRSFNILSSLKHLKATNISVPDSLWSVVWNMISSTIEHKTTKASKRLYEYVM
jgi:hypothetical protein